MFVAPTRRKDSHPCSALLKMTPVIFALPLLSSRQGFTEIKNNLFLGMTKGVRKPNDRHTDV
jgi:hypothetical protein